MPISIAFDFMMDKTYLFKDAQAHRPSAQYGRAIMRYGISCNIVDLANNLSFAYRGIALKLRVFVLLPTKSTRVVNFIYILKKKQEAWHKIITLPTVSN